MKKLICLFVLLVACNKTTTTAAAEDVASGTDATTLAGDATPTDTVATVAFGATCTVNADCGAGGMTCFAFGDGTSHCTFPCKAAGDCPSGSAGQQCNGKGYCKP